MRKSERTMCGTPSTLTASQRRPLSVLMRYSESVIWHLWLGIYSKRTSETQHPRCTSKNSATGVLMSDGDSWEECKSKLRPPTFWDFIFGRTGKGQRAEWNDTAPEVRLLP